MMVNTNWIHSQNILGKPKVVNQIKNKNSKKRGEGNVICLKQLGLHNIRGHWWFLFTKFASKKKNLAIKKVARKLSRFLLQTIMWRILYSRLYSAFLATFVTYSKKLNKEWLPLSKANNWANSSRSLKPFIMILQNDSVVYGAALKWAFKRCASELNKILIKINILDFNGKKFSKTDSCTFLVETEFGNFKIKLVKITNSAGLVLDLHLIVPIKLFVTSYLYKVYDFFGVVCQFDDRTKLYKTRLLKEARKNIYEIPLKRIEEILITFFDTTDITSPHQITTKLSKTISSTKSSNKIIFSVSSLLSKQILSKAWINKNIRNRNFRSQTQNFEREKAILDVNRYHFKKKARFFTSKLNQDIA